MFTKFTINQSIAIKKAQVLENLIAIPMAIHAAKIDGIFCGSTEYMGVVTKWHKDLPEGATFCIPQKMSRSQLKKIFGSSSMVRGVSNF